mgnify:CR=1 FL=1
MLNKVLLACPKESRTTMVEIPPYIRLVANQQPNQRRSVGASRPTTASEAVQGEERTSAVAVARLPLAGDAVEVRTARYQGEHQDILDYTDQDLAEQALDDLSRDLPALGQGVHDLHSDLDRGRVLALLAPLMESDPISY